MHRARGGTRSSQQTVPDPRDGTGSGQDALAAFKSRERVSVDDQISDLTFEPAFDESALAMFGDESHAIRVGRFLLRHGPELAGWPAQTVPDSRQDESIR